MSSFWQFARLMLRDRGRLSLAIFFAFLSAGGLGVGLLSLGPMMAMILNPDPAERKSLVELATEYNADSPIIRMPEWVIAQLPDSPFEGILLIIGGLAVLTVFGAIANFLHQYISYTITTKVVALIRLQAFHRIIHLPLGRVIERGPSEFIARIIRDCSELQRGFIALTSKTVAQATKGIAALVVAIVVEPGLSLLFMIVAPFLAMVLRKLGKRIRRGTRGALRAQEVLLRISTESLQGLRSVKANVAEKKATRQFAKANREVIHQELRVRSARALSAPLVETIAIFAIGGLAIIAAKQILDGNLQIERFILALAALAVAGASFRPITGLVTEIQAASAPADRLRDMLDEPDENAVGFRRPQLKRHQRDIAFDHVTLVYSGAETPALNDVSLTIQHGERIAIVGPNGSGKTTLLSLVPRLLRPSSGRVLIDGTDIATVSLRSLRRQVGVVTQETVLFLGTVSDNIAFGLEGVTREQIIDAARRAHAEAFILNLPGGYDANIREQGASLSGGQRQRLAIARAILRNPSILILDEATSQIDAESEAHINAALEEFCQGRTSLIIAHRLSTVLNADRIIVMNDGAIVDAGTHEELLERCELYRRLVSHQMFDGEAPPPGTKGRIDSDQPRLRIRPASSE